MGTVRELEHLPHEEKLRELDLLQTREEDFKDTY